LSSSSPTGSPSKSSSTSSPAKKKKKKLDKSDRPRLPISDFLKQFSKPGVPLNKGAAAGPAKMEGAKISRERAKPTFTLQNKEGRGASKKKNGSRKSDVSAQAVRLRVEENPEQGLEVLHGQLFCAPCSTNVCSSKSNCEKHLATRKHIMALAKSARAADNGAMLTKQLRVFYEDNATETVGVAGMERVDDDTQLFRAEILESWIESGIPVNKLEKNLRAILEKYAKKSLTHPNNLMKTFMGPLCAKELELLKTELKGQFIGNYNDGTTHLGEAFSQCVRYMTEDMVLQTRCARVAILAATLDAAEISGELLTTIAQDLQLRLIDVLAWMNDAASPNTAAFNHVLSAACPASTQNNCLGHTFSHVGQALGTPYLDAFLLLWSTIVSHSANARRLFSVVTGIVKAERKSSTRWDTVFKICQISLLPSLMSKKLLTWAKELVRQELCEKTAVKLVEFLSDPRRAVLLEVEIATMVLGVSVIYEMTTKIQGDGFEFLTMHDDVIAMGLALKAPIKEELRLHITALAASAASIPIKKLKLPSVPVVSASAAAAVLPPPPRGTTTRKAALGVAAATQAAGGSSQAASQAALPSSPKMLNNVEDLMEYSRGVARPAAAYFDERVLGRDGAQLRRMSAGSYFNPISVNLPSELGITNLVRVFPMFMKHPRLVGAPSKMSAEIPTYISLINSIPPASERMDDEGHDTFDIAVFWRRAARKLPATALALRAVITNSPNSAPPERVFSILNDTFDDDQTTSLSDYIQLSLQLQYNARGRNRAA
jgi:ribosomal protein L6P/L9E